MFEIKTQAKARTLNAILNQQSPEYIKNFFPPELVDKDQNGYPICKFCGEPRYAIVKLDGKDRAFPVLCDCLKNQE